MTGREDGTGLEQRLCEALSGEAPSLLARCSLVQPNGLEAHGLLGLGARRLAFVADDVLAGKITRVWERDALRDVRSSGGVLGSDVRFRFGDEAVELRRLEDGPCATLVAAFASAPSGAASDESPPLPAARPTPPPAAPTPPASLAPPAPVALAELEIAVARSEPPLDAKLRRLVRAIASDVMLYEGKLVKAYGGGPLPGKFAATVREGHELFVSRGGSGLERGFAAEFADVAAATARNPAIDAAAVLRAIRGSTASATDRTPAGDAAAGELRLIVRRRGPGESVFPLRGGELTVGRAQDCDICLPDVSLSRRHARLAREGDGWRVVDLASANGTFVNERPAESGAPVRGGDRLRFGSVECEVAGAEGGADPSAGAAPRKPWWKFW
ncbi:MAG: FHA domain-containing protein [Deltaproteobacteria bacterium]|nr:FHA domain-containing protein [Deltaproteobacteria bacterium]